LKTGANFTAQYVLATYSSHKVVQSSWTSGPFSSTLDVNHLIPGWVTGLSGMKVGGRRELVLPPADGYGSNAPGNGIAANDTLIFVVDLLKVG
jgi:peptidylprolyl isomerase